MAMTKKDIKDVEELQEEESDDEDIPPCCCSSGSVVERRKWSLKSTLKRAFGFGSKRKNAKGSLSLGKDSHEDFGSTDDDWPPVKRTGPYHKQTIVAPVAKSKNNRVIIGRAAPSFNKSPQRNRVRVTIEHVRIVPDHMHSETVLSEMRQDGVTVTKSQLLMDSPWASVLNKKKGKK